ncbi:hypothetical protein M752DRAFT_265902 [Aspergillus phoenicis ATCC 13157]|uniref:Peptidase S8/S53 domain-containing protein n=1 Tax=Aspergillus phoenicis ATCC 13157 TaxID=1353007 RepID=A0A370PLH5_ASPPH|nr:hypothetical protein M752DRAFT_265902 [Aspergillus phoenicis ATCC 13157]GLA29423.1 hypothetical protein AnigIFM63326_007329 [Aspergillus niger]
MDQFALIVKNYHRHLGKYSPTVKVAIIDDGIDPLQANLQENIDGGASFHHRPGRPDRPIYYWSAPGGHGTEMAKLICRICPKACLCIIHLGEGLGEEEARQIKPETAIEAIKWATTAGVHITSMSWSIIQSKMSGDPYSAATIDDEKWSKTGAQKLDFYPPGENLPLRDQLHPHQFPLQSLSGSLLATAVAARLAALLQYCMGTAARKPENKPELSKKDPEIPEIHKYLATRNYLTRLRELRIGMLGLPLSFREVIDDGAIYRDEILATQPFSSLNHNDERIRIRLRLL